MKIFKSVFIIILGATLLASCGEKTDSQKLAEIMCEDARLFQELLDNSDNSEKMEAIKKESDENEAKRKALISELEVKFKDDKKGMIQVQIGMLEELLSHCSHKTEKSDASWIKMKADLESEFKTLK